MKRTLMLALSVVGLVLGLTLAGPFAASASEAPCVPPSTNISDYTDPVTGVTDFDAYLAALNSQDICAAGSETRPGLAGSLPYTGSSVNDLLAVGVAAIVAGGVVAGTASYRRRRFA